MSTIKKGDIVSRNSYNNDILFYVESIENDDNRGKIAFLKGVTIRIVADSYIDDLKLLNKRAAEEDFNRIKRKEGLISSVENRNSIRYGKILHLDGECSFVYIFKSLQIQG